VRRFVVPAIVLALLTTGCLGGDSRADRPDWMTDALEQGLIRTAREAKSADPNVTVERAFVVRTTARELARLATGIRPSPRTVYVVELWGDMTICHGAPPGVDPCTRTDGVTVFYDTNLSSHGTSPSRLDVEQLGEPFDLTSRLD
jgi:hypothetical protein